MFSKLHESLIHVFEESDFDSAFQPISKAERDERLKDRIERLVKEQEWILNDDGTYSCKYDVDLFDLHLTQLPVKFKEVKGHFDCSYNQLTSLKGCPIDVRGSFYCDNNELISLYDAPKRVGKDFNCSFNKITSLIGVPKVINGNFKCMGNRLTSLEGAPLEVKGVFFCSDNLVPKEKLKQTVKRDYLR